EDGDRHAALPVVLVGREEVAAEPEAGRVHAAARQHAGLDEGEEGGPAVGRDAQDDGGGAAGGTPVPVLADDDAAAGELGEDDGAGAAVVGGPVEQLGARVERHDLGQRAPAALGDAAHLL